MGFAMGQMFKEEVANLLPMMDPWIEGKILAAVPWLPKSLVDIVVEYGVPVALQLTWNVTKSYSPKSYVEEIQGLADGAGVDVQRVQNVNMFPELLKAHCTIIGANGRATIGTSARGGIAHLRGLDFDPTAPMVNMPSVVVYHSQDTPKVINFGWVSMVGVLTGFSNTSIGIGEKAWGGPEASKILPYPGEPWMFILRDILQLPDMKSIIRKVETAPKTVAIHIGVGDSVSNEFLGFEMTTNYSKMYTWDTHRNETTHPDFEGIVYWEKNDPARTMCDANLLKSQYGNITAEWLATQYAGYDRTGDTHLIAFDYTHKTALVANARKATSDGPLDAYNRRFTWLNMTALFNEML